MTSVTGTFQLTISDVARICHEANRGYCEAQEDHSQKPWSQAPLWQRTSAINGVLFTLANPDAGPEANHVSWLKEKEADGWVYGPEKSETAKTHPCVLPYDQLPLPQRLKDDLFRAIVLTFKDHIVHHPAAS